MSNLLNSSLTGLLAAQAGLRTTANNTANVNTEGYARQRVEQNALPVGDQLEENAAEAKDVDAAVVEGAADKQLRWTVLARRDEISQRAAFAGAASTKIFLVNLRT